MENRTEIETLELLASRYVGSKVDRSRSHAFELGAPKSLCGRIAIEGAAYGAGDVSAAPTCPTCLKRDPRVSQLDRDYARSSRVED